VGRFTCRSRETTTASTRSSRPPARSTGRPSSRCSRTDADWDFYEVDERVFAPAKVTVDVVDGPVYTVGETDEELLAESFGYR